TFVVSDKMQSEQEWMMFTFVSNTYNGVLAEHCNEGELEWVPVDAIKTLPMAEGDRKIFEHVLTTDTMLFGSFYYTVDYELQGMGLIHQDNKERYAHDRNRTRNETCCHHRHVWCRQNGGDPRL